MPARDSLPASIAVAAGAGAGDGPDTGESAGMVAGTGCVPVRSVYFYPRVVSDMFRQSLKDIGA